MTQGNANRDTDRQPVRVIEIDDLGMEAVLVKDIPQALLLLDSGLSRDRRVEVMSEMIGRTATRESRRSPRE